MTIKLRSAINSASILPTGFPLELGSQQAQGVTIDNYSGFWLQVGSGPLFVPPYTIGWASNLFGTVAGSVLIRKATPTSSLVNPSPGSQEGSVIAALYEEAIGPSGGYPIINKPQRIGNFSGTQVAGGLVANLSITAETLQFLSVSFCTATAGVIGRIYLFVQENSGGGFEDLYEGLCQTNAPLNIIIPFIPLFVPSTFTGDTQWTIDGQIDNVVGVGTYSWDVTVGSQGL